MRKLRRWWLLLLIVPLALGGAFVLWAESTPSPTSEALRALETGPEVRVASDPWLVFHPQVQTKKAGLIFYPGGRVDPRAYAPMARSIAAEGYLAVIVPMPLNLAVFDWDAADRVMLAYPEISSWVIGGHSLGGAMADSVRPPQSRPHLWFTAAGGLPGSKRRSIRYGIADYVCLWDARWAGDSR